MKNHAEAFLKQVTEAKQHIKEISAQTLKDKIDKQEELVLIDVREDHEWANGHLPNAIHLSKGVIERDIEKVVPNFTQQIVVYCSGGFRSALVADSLQHMGYKDVYSLDKGSQSWIDTGYALSAV